jgi:3-oxoacyl-[acyl-carrier protein] reductase
VARELARRGAVVAIFDRDRQGLDVALAALAADGLTAEGHCVDVSEEDAARQAVARVVSKHGRLDVMVHCAAIVGPNARKVTEVTAEEFDQVYRANLRSSFLMTKYALLEMEKRNYGRILLFSSIAGKEGNPGTSPYSSTKAGVIGLVKAVGKEYAETGITVNAIAPAVIQTPMVDGMDPRQVKYMTDRIPMKRVGTADEAASLACWIVSREASFNTAFTFDLSGGRATY